MVLEGLGLPFPSEVIMVFAGFLSVGSVGLFVVYALAGSVGGFVGNLLLYYISVYGGRPLILFIVQERIDHHNGIVKINLPRGMAIPC